MLASMNEESVKLSDRESSLWNTALSLVLKNQEMQPELFHRLIIDDSNGMLTSIQKANVMKSVVVES